MDYSVVFIADDELPDGHDWAMIRSTAGVVLAVKRDRLTPRVLEEAWCAYRRLARESPHLVAAV